MMDKQEILEKLKNAGITEDDIHAAFSVTTDVELLRQNEMLKAKVGKYEDQLRQAVEMTNKAVEQKKIVDAVNRETLISQIIVDSGNRWTKAELDTKTTGELNLLKTCYEKSMDNTFASIAAYEAEQRNRNTQRLSAFGADVTMGAQ